MAQRSAPVSLRLTGQLVLLFGGLASELILGKDHHGKPQAFRSALRQSRLALIDTGDYS